MALGRVFEGKSQKGKMKHSYGGRPRLNSDNYLVIRIPDAQVLRIMSRSLFLAMALVTFSCLGTLFKGLSSGSHSVVSKIGTTSGSINVEVLNLLLHDLAEEGLLRKEGKALIMGPPYGFKGVIPLTNNQIDLVIDSDAKKQSSFSEESYDFVFTPSLEDAELIDRILKMDGIVALPVGSNLSNVFRKQPNYKVVYLRRYSSIIVALRKNGPATKLLDFSPKRKLFIFSPEAKKMALRGLEDVLLEPPQRALVNSKKYLKKIRYLPELLGDSLEGYTRRIFVSVGLPEENRVVIKWFQKNYPRNNQKFEIHRIPVAVPEEASQEFVAHTDVSAWLSKHVKEEEYVVMKAEADVVEDMMKKNTINLVDELFVECENNWWHSGKRKKSGRAYWECLALYGRLRDEGVAVHQWWG